MKTIFFKLLNPAIIGLILVFISTGCTIQVVQEDKKPVTQQAPKEEKKGKAVHPVAQQSPDLRPWEQLQEKPKPREEKLGDELMEAVKKLKENVVTLKTKLDEEVTQNEALFKKEPPHYRVRPGDVIEIIYHILYEENPGDYLLEVQDSVKIEFFNQPDLNRTVSVRSDGKVTLPLVGDLPASGLTTAQLEKEIIQRYRKYIVDPLISIYLERFNVKIDELKKAITTAARGQSKIAPVRPDGRITFSFIGDVKVAGHTVPEIHKIVNEKYRPFVRNLEVTVVVERVVNPTIYVSGEVNSPGELTITGPLFLSQVISRAKGLTPLADSRHIMVIRRYGVEKPLVFGANVHDVLKKGDLVKDILIAEDDMVYVPRASRDRFFVLGEVGVPGVYPIFPEEPLTLSQAISMANGFRPTSALSSVMVLRRVEGDKPVAFQVNFKEVLSEGNMTNDIVLQKNDVVYVPKTFIANVNDFIDQWFTRGIYSLFPAGSTLDFIIDLDTVRNIHRRTYGF
jgi:polysaccharide export outer membrane protein